MRLMHVTKVSRCRCAAHALVRLEDDEDGPVVHLQVDPEAGRAILGELCGLSGAHAQGIDLLAATLRALGARAQHIALRDAGGAAAHLALCGPRGRAMVSLDLGQALLASCRLKLPLLLAAAGPAAATSVPTAYHHLLDSLRLEALDGDADGEAG